MEWQNHKKNNEYKVVSIILIFFQQTTKRTTLIIKKKNAISFHDEFCVLTSEFVIEFKLSIVN
jgi:hypothetical protein